MHTIRHWRKFGGALFLDVTFMITIELSRMANSYVLSERLLKKHEVKGIFETRAKESYLSWQESYLSISVNK